MRPVDRTATGVGANASLSNHSRVPRAATTSTTSRVGASSTTTRPIAPPTPTTGPSAGRTTVRAPVGLQSSAALQSTVQSRNISGLDATPRAKRPIGSSIPSTTTTTTGASSSTLPRPQRAITAGSSAHSGMSSTTTSATSSSSSRIPKSTTTTTTTSSIPPRRAAAGTTSSTAPGHNTPGHVHHGVRPRPGAPTTTATAATTTTTSQKAPLNPNDPQAKLNRMLQFIQDPIPAELKAKCGCMNIADLPDMSTQAEARQITRLKTEAKPSYTGSMRDQRNEEKQLITDHMALLKSLYTKYTAATTTHQDLLRVIMKLRAEYGAAKTQYQTTQQGYQVLQEEWGALQEKQGGLEEQSLILHQQLAQLKQAEQNALHSLQLTEKQLEAAKKRIAELREGLSSDSDELLDQKMKLQDAVALVDELTQEYKNISSQIAYYQTNEHIQHILDDFNTKQQDYQALQQKKRELKEEAMAIESKSLATSQEFTQLQSSCEDATITCSDMRKDAHRKQFEVENLQQALEKKQQEVERTRAKLDVLMVDVERLGQERHALQPQYDAALQLFEQRKLRCEKLAESELESRAMTDHILNGLQDFTAEKQKIFDQYRDQITQNELATTTELAALDEEMNNMAAEYHSVLSKEQTRVNGDIRELQRKQQTQQEAVGLSKKDRDEEEKKEALLKEQHATLQGRSQAYDDTERLAKLPTHDIEMKILELMQRQEDRKGRIRRLQEEQSQVDDAMLTIKRQRVEEYRNTNDHLTKQIRKFGGDSLLVQLVKPKRVADFSIMSHDQMLAVLQRDPVMSAKLGASEDTAMVDNIFAVKDDDTTMNDGESTAAGTSARRARAAKTAAPATSASSSTAPPQQLSRARQAILERQRLAQLNANGGSGNSDNTTATSNMATNTTTRTAQGSTTAMAAVSMMVDSSTTTTTARKPLRRSTAATQQGATTDAATTAGLTRATRRPQ